MKAAPCTVDLDLGGGPTSKAKATIQLVQGYRAHLESPLRLQKELCALTLGYFISLTTSLGNVSF